MRPDANEGEKRTNEIGTILPLLETLPDIAGLTVTADAFAHPAGAGEVICSGAAPTTCSPSRPTSRTCSTISASLSMRPSPGARHSSIDEGAKPEHGRRERRSIWVSTELNDYLDFPGVGQVFAIRRDTVEVKSAKRRVETVYGVTSLTPQGASPQRLLSLNRGHWSIEAMHHILDWSFDEDRSRIRTGHGPQNMTRLRRFAIGIIKAPRARCRRDHAPSCQEPAPRPRLPQNDRQRRPATSARLSAPCPPRPSPRRQPPRPRGARGHAQTTP